MVLGYEHLVNYEVRFGFNLFYEKNSDINVSDWTSEVLTSVSFSKVTDKKAVFAAGRKHYVAIEEGATIIAGRFVVPALDSDRNTPFTNLLDYVIDKTNIDYTSVDDIVVPINCLFYNRVTGKNFFLNDIVFTNVSTEKDVTSNKTLYVVDYFCSRLTYNKPITGIDVVAPYVSETTKNTSTETTETDFTNTSTFDSSVNLSSNIDIELICSKFKDVPDNLLESIRYQDSATKRTLSFKIPKVCLQENSSLQTYEYTYSLPVSGGASVAKVVLINLYPTIVSVNCLSECLSFSVSGPTSPLTDFQSSVDLGNDRKNFLIELNLLSSLFDYCIDKNIIDSYGIDVLPDKSIFFLERSNTSKISFTNPLAGKIILPSISIDSKTFNFFDDVKILNCIKIAKNKTIDNSSFSFDYYFYTIDSGVPDKPYYISEYGVQLYTTTPASSFFDTRIKESLLFAPFIKTFESETDDKKTTVVFKNIKTTDSTSVEFNNGNVLFTTLTNYIPYSDGFSLPYLPVVFLDPKTDGKTIPDSSKFVHCLLVGVQFVLDTDSIPLSDLPSADKSKPTKLVSVFDPTSVEIPLPIKGMKLPFIEAMSTANFFGYFLCGIVFYQPNGDVVCVSGFYSYKGASYSLEYLSALSGTDGVITSLDKTKTQYSEGDIVAVLANRDKEDPSDDSKIVYCKDTIDGVECYVGLPSIDAVDSGFVLFKTSDLSSSTGTVNYIPADSYSGSIAIKTSASGDVGSSTISVSNSDVDFSDFSVPSSHKGYKYVDLINKYSKQFSVPPKIIGAIIQTESTFNPNADNPKSTALGLAQLLTPTCKDIVDRYKAFGLSSASDLKTDSDPKKDSRIIPEISIKYLCVYFAYKVKEADGNLAKAIKRYGENTNEYLNKVLKNAKDFGYKTITSSAGRFVKDFSTGYVKKFFTEKFFQGYTGYIGKTATKFVGVKRYSQDKTHAPGYQSISASDCSASVSRLLMFANSDVYNFKTLPDVKALIRNAAGLKEFEYSDGKVANNSKNIDHIKSLSEGAFIFFIYGTNNHVGMISISGNDRLLCDMSSSCKTATTKVSDLFPCRSALDRIIAISALKVGGKVYSASYIKSFSS